MLVLEDQMALLSLTTHTILAGFVGGATNVAQTVVGPILSPLVEVSGAAATALVAAHAVTQIAAAHGLAPQHAFRIAMKIAPQASRTHGCVSAKALHLATDIGSPSLDTARLGAAVIVHMIQSRVLSGLNSVATCWCPPLAVGVRVAGLTRSVVASALFLRTIERAAAREAQNLAAAA
jgi:hypothetical protein